MATKNGKEVEQTMNEDTSSMPDESDMEEEQIGFPPYWNPEIGKKFYARVEQLDMRDPAFVRYVCSNQGDPLDCFTGPTDDQKEKIVRKGERFSLSAYAALPLHDYIGFNVLVTVKGKQKVPNQPSPMWIFSIAISKSDKQRLLTMRRGVGKRALALRKANPVTSNEDDIPFG
jgi:hypothetical protein